MRKLVLWGHHLDEYQEMFDCSLDNQSLRILEYGCGASAVNKEGHDHGMSVVSCDPLFVLDKSTLSTQVSLIFEDMLDQMKMHQSLFDFSAYGGFDAFIAHRRDGVRTFFEDYELGLQEERYCLMNDLNLSFPDFSFDLALSSHYLFADLDNQDGDFHLNAILELARVAKEVRIFPLIDRYGVLSPLLGPVLLGLQKNNYGVEVKEVKYHLQPKGNAMLRVWAQHCELGVA